MRQMIKFCTTSCKPAVSAQILKILLLYSLIILSTMAKLADRDINYIEIDLDKRMGEGPHPALRYLDANSDDSSMNTIFSFHYY